MSHVTTAVLGLEGQRLGSVRREVNLTTGRVRLQLDVSVRVDDVLRLARNVRTNRCDGGRDDGAGRRHGVGSALDWRWIGAGLELVGAFWRGIPLIVFRGF